MTHDQIEQQSQQEYVKSRQYRLDAFLPRLRAYLSSVPEVRLAYFQQGPDEEQLALSGPDRPRIILSFSRSVSGEHIGKRLIKVRNHFTSSIKDEVDFLDIERLDYREACEVAFNAHPVYGSMEAVERDRLYRYNVYLEWNAGRRISGVKQEMPPVLNLSPDRPLRVINIGRFIAPLYRHLKLIEGHLRELKRLSSADITAFSADSTTKSLTESYMLKAIQSTILITMSVMHRSMRLAARDYRDLFLLMPVFGMASRERASKLAKCADIRDKLMFQYEDITAIEVYQQAQEVIEALQDFKTFMLEWLFEHYYGASGELIQCE
jgi:uncharacterized protein YutE (UPF0331/DUF86 family)